MDVIAILACAMAVFYYLSWRKTQADLDALFDAVLRVAHGEARIHFDGTNINIKDNDQ